MFCHQFNKNDVDVNVLERYFVLNSVQFHRTRNSFDTVIAVMIFLCAFLSDGNYVLRSDDVIISVQSNKALIWYGTCLNYTYYTCGTCESFNISSFYSILY